MRTCLFTFWVSEFLVTILRVVAGCRTEQGNARKDASSTTKNEIAMLSENFPNLAPNQRVSAVGKHNKQGLSQEEQQNKKKEGRPRCSAQTSDPAHSGYCARIPLKLNPHNQGKRAKAGPVTSAGVRRPCSLRTPRLGQHKLNLPPPRDSKPAH